MPSSAVGFNFSAGGLLSVVSAGFSVCAVLAVAGAAVTVGLDDATGVITAGLGVGAAATGAEGVVVAGAEGALTAEVVVVVVVGFVEAGAPNDADVLKLNGAAAGDLAPGTVFFAKEPKPPDPSVDVDPNALVAGGVAAAGAFIVDVEPNKDGEGDAATRALLLLNKEEGIVVDGDVAPGTVFFASEPKPPLPNVLVDPNADVVAGVGVTAAGSGASAFFSSLVLKEPNEREVTSGSVFGVLVVAVLSFAAGVVAARAGV